MNKRITVGPPRFLFELKTEFLYILAEFIDSFSDYSNYLFFSRTNSQHVLYSSCQVRRLLFVKNVDN